MTAAAAQDYDESQPLRMRVADEVRAWLGRRRVSGAQLARQMGKSQTFVARRLDGRQAFDVDDLDAVARILDVPVSAFFGGPKSGYDVPSEPLNAESAQVIPFRTPVVPHRVAHNPGTTFRKSGVTQWMTPDRTGQLPEVA